MPYPPPFPAFHTNSRKWKTTNPPARESPLATIPDWLNIHFNLSTGEALSQKEAKPGGDDWVPAMRETNTMPQWAGSCWYHLRYLDPKNADALVDIEKEKYWGSPDFYIGGAEHAVLHLLYAPFLAHFPARHRCRHHSRALPTPLPPRPHPWRRRRKNVQKPGVMSSTLMRSSTATVRTHSGSTKCSSAGGRQTLEYGKYPRHLPLSPQTLELPH